ncbi:Lytic transglycosylase catalytic [Parvibaculum lavamentivorans DS-1]|uniref:Lytic transglycosylase catalytic n=1 Tax=Parvibaculum lavamentivorans (strain DS-1 / DSM 13023 / NCIMB 13966) TaxID=402881 RepID=A7HUM7_PARL1|nr:transglycosylase SLT domain-containing protein [Parvibaculum lavamentivorans]ABS63610.1 Lytic transglycosylase catalytic [Parvibaculum lavamentivorans DS-1]
MASHRTSRDFNLRTGFCGFLAVLIAATASPHAAFSRESDGAVHDPVNACEDAAIHHEQANGLPRALLAAVALAESGRYSPTTRKARAWPWTINAEGRPYYFKTKQEAIATTQRLLDSGMRSIDIGCMQVNLRYHPDAFISLEDGFDPMTNVAYGAEFLMRLHERAGSWEKAVAHYHSQTASRGGRYFARVIRIWENERTRVAQRSYAAAPPKIDVSDFLKPAVGPGVSVLAMNEAAEPTAISYRPAPKVLDAAPEQNVRETASAAVGLRLSIADQDVAEAASTTERREPRVLDPMPAGPTRVADVSIPGA